MSLLNCIRENFNALAELQRQATDKINDFVNEDTSSENVVQRNLALLEEGTLFEDSTSEQNVTPSTNQLSAQHTSSIDSRVPGESSVSASTSTLTSTNHGTLGNPTLKSTTLHGPALHNGLSDDYDEGDVNYDDSSTESPSPVSESQDRPNMPSRPSTLGDSNPQTSGLRRQWMNNHRRDNHRFITENNNNLSVEHHDHDNFGAPLERVNARQTITNSSTEMQNQAGNQIGGNSEQPYSGFGRENPNFEVTQGNNNRAPTGYMTPFNGLLQVPTSNSQPSTSLYPHLPAHIHRTIMPSLGPNNLDSRDTAQDTAIEQVFIPAENTERDSCVICKDPFDVAEHCPVKIHGCAHVFGKLCIKRWLKENRNKTCPMCRKFVDISKIRSAEGC